MLNAGYTSIEGKESQEEDRLPLDGFPSQGNKQAASSAKTVLVSVILLCSLSFNVYSFFRSTYNSQSLFFSSYSGLGYDTPITYHALTDYFGENQTLSNMMWDSIDTSPISIALDHVWAKEHGLPVAGDFPWDDSKGTYFVKAFHQLHCLKLMRRTTLNYRDGHVPTNSWRHYEHCLDALRKDVMCRADDTPMPGHPDRHLGEGQVMQCRNWDALIAWTQEPARQSCYRSVSDYREVKHTLERYAFCPPDSPYFGIQNAYFRKFGHKDLFEPLESEDT